MNIKNANLNFKNMSYGNIPKSLVLHHAEASKCSVQDIHRWHLGNGWSGIGYHYFVRKNGDIWKGRPDNVIGAHVAGFNVNSIGICAEGSYMTEAMPEPQKQALIELGKYLCNKYGINKVYGHREVGASNCPGTNYPLTEIRNNILNNKPNKEEDYDMDKLVVYFGALDALSAVLVSQKHQCPMMLKKDFEDKKLKVKEIIIIGGKPGTDRYDSFKDAAKLV